MKKYRFYSGLIAFFLLACLCALPAAALEDPAPQCRAAIVVDGDYGDVLYAYNAYEKMYPASITKIMTSLLVLEAVDSGQLTLDQPITASTTAAVVPEGSSTANPRIEAGEVLTVEQLLYCDLITSANEACNILAETVGGSIENFVDMMNAKARELGMEDTHFVNPHGFHDEDHYTTAYDITIMARAAMEHETFRTIVATQTYTIPATNLNGERVLHTTNALIGNWIYSGYLYSKAIGIKTGSTTPAGQCLASAAVDDDGRTYYCVVLGAETVDNGDGTTTRYSFYESRRLLEWAFDSFERVTLLDENTEGVLREVSVSLSDETDHVIVQPVGSIEATLPTDYDPARVEYQVELADGVEAPVEKGTKLGTVSVVYDDVNYGTLDLVAADSVARSDFQYYVKTVKDYLGMWWVRALLIVAVALILFLVVWLGVIRPRRKRRYRYSSRSGGRRYQGRRRR